MEKSQLCHCITTPERNFISVDRSLTRGIGRLDRVGDGAGLRLPDGVDAADSELVLLGVAELLAGVAGAEDVLGHDLPLLAVVIAHLDQVPGDDAAAIVRGARPHQVDAVLGAFRSERLVGRGLGGLWRLKERCKDINLNKSLYFSGKFYNICEWT